MNARKLAGLAGVLALIPLAPHAVANTVAHAEPTQSTGAARPESTAAAKADPKGTRYLYKGSYEVVMNHALVNPWGGSDKETWEASAEIRGTFPKLRMTQQEELVNLSPTGSTSRVVWAGAVGNVSLNNGQLTRKCEGYTGKVSGRPMMVPGPFGFGTITPYTLLKVPTVCTFSDGTPPTDLNQYYGPLSATLVDPVTPGAKTVKYEIDLSAGTSPHLKPELCPGYLPGQSTKCEYTILGTLTLELIKKLPPTKNPPATKASITKGATQVTTAVQCPAKCGISISVTPLKGGPRIAVPIALHPKPGKTVPVKIAIPAKKRPLVRKAGGVSLKLAFDLGRGIKYVETRSARL